MSNADGAHTLAELQEALRGAGHGADEVQNSPVDALNLFLNDRGRAPHATIICNGDLFEWGHQWQWNSPTTVPLDETVRRVVDTATEEARNPSG